MGHLNGVNVALSDSQRVDAYRFFAIAFGAAPGAEYYNQLVEAYDFGLTTKEVVNIFTTKSQFTSVYAISLSNAEFANKIVENVVGTSATEAAKSLAKADVKAALDVGWTRGDIVYQLFSNLASKPSTDADWANTAKLMANQVEVAKYVTEYRPLVTTDLSTLQSAIKSVTAATDVSTLEALKAVIAATGVNMGGLVPQTSSADIYNGTAGNDSVDGGIGNDTLKGGDGNDVLFGGSGNDSLYGERGQDYIEGGDGADRIELGTYYTSDFVPGYYDAVGNYIPGYSVYTVDAYYEVADGGDGSDQIYGSYGSDKLYGGEGADTIRGEGFNSIGLPSYITDTLSLATLSRLYKDTIYGGNGDDSIYGEAGDDVIYGGEGNDNIQSGYGNDFVDAGDGADRVYSNSGSDTILGGLGDDDISISELSAGVVAWVDAGDGKDTISLYADEDGIEASLIAGGGVDTVEIRTYSDAKIAVDLREALQARDEIGVSWNANNKPLNPVVVHGFSLANDVLDLGGFNLFGVANTTSYNLQTLHYSTGVITRNYSQEVSSTTTPWMGPSGTGVDALGKGFFVIKGAQAAAADVTTVAAFLDPYGNNATYGKSHSHYFAFDVADVGLAIYKFTDDTGANARVVADELTPVVVLAGLSTSQLDVSQAKFLLTV